MSITTAPRAPGAPPIAGDDILLARRIRSGDQVALGELYDRYSSLALGAIVGLAPDRESAEEAVHDAFLAAWCGIDRFDATRGDLESWLIALARRHMPGGLSGR